MHTNAWFLAFVCSTAFAQSELAASEQTLNASRFELGLAPEVTLVGLTYGVRPEVLYRFGEVHSASRLRFAVGFFSGLEQFFLPVSFGYRAVFRQKHVVHPLLGAGLEYQGRFTSGFHPIHAGGIYLEGGVSFQVAPRWSVGLLAQIDVMFIGTPGFGLGPRAFLTWRL